MSKQTEPWIFSKKEKIWLKTPPLEIMGKLAMESNLVLTSTEIGVMITNSNSLKIMKTNLEDMIRALNFMLDHLHSVKKKLQL